MGANKPVNTWTCSNCGEIIEENFDSCWHCGTGSDGTPPMEAEAYEYAQVYEASDEAPCPICGRADYAWGKLTAGANLGYVEPTASAIGRHFAVITRRCLACGNLQMFERRSPGI